MFHAMIDNMDDLIDRLCNTNRWETYNVINSNSVAEHSYIVANISYQIALSIDGCDEDEVVKRALFHDIGEAYTGDIPRFSKRKTEGFKDSLEIAEEKLIKEELNSSDVDQKYFEKVINFWKNAKDDSVEGMVIKQADILAALYEVYKEIKMGNEQIKDYEDVDKGIKYAIKVCSGTEKSEEFLNEILEEIGWNNK